MKAGYIRISPKVQFWERRGYLSSEGFFRIITNSYFGNIYQDFLRKWQLLQCYEWSFYSTGSQGGWGEGFCPTARGHFTMSRSIFDCHTWTLVLLAPRGYKLRMPLSTLQCTGQPMTKNYLAKTSVVPLMTSPVLRTGVSSLAEH